MSRRDTLLYRLTHTIMECVKDVLYEVESRIAEIGGKEGSRGLWLTTEERDWLEAAFKNLSTAWLHLKELVEEKKKCGE